MNEIRRNDPCPCGSGKKYKHCCMINKQQIVGLEESVRSNLIREMIKYFKKHYSDSMKEAFEYFIADYDFEDIFRENIDLEMTLDINFLEWYVHDWLIEYENGKTLIELYTEHKSKLKTIELNVLTKMQESFLSLYEVQEIHDDEGIVVMDLLLGEKYFIKEKDTLEDTQRWDIFAARLIKIDGDYIISGSMYNYPIFEKKLILENLEECYKDFKQNNPLKSKRDFLKLHGNLFNYHWCENVIQLFDMSPTDPDGNPLTLYTAEYELKDTGEVIKRLKQMPDMIQDERFIFDWLDDTADESSPVVLGTIIIEENILELECDSEELFENCKAKLLQRLEGLIVHKNDYIEDDFDPFEDFPDDKEDGDSDFLEDLDQEQYNEQMREFYEDWLNEKIPALNNQTPLEMVKKPHGKKKVAEILKSIENAEAHMRGSGEPHFDFGWLWERLGINR